MGSCGILSIVECVRTISPKAMEKSLEGFKQRRDLMIFSFQKNKGLQREEYLRVV